MVKVPARVLPAPQLNLGSQDEVLTPCNGTWDLRGKHLHSGAQLDFWSVVCFALEPNQRSNDLLTKFCNALTSMSCREGMKMAKPAARTYLRDSREVRYVLLVISWCYRNHCWSAVSYRVMVYCLCLSAVFK